MSKLLTPLELKVMNILWKLETAFVKEVIAQWPDEPKPAYNTISTIVRILEEKGIVGFKAYGRSHQYFPILTKNKYQKGLIRNVVDNAFAGSLSSLVSNIIDNDKFSESELEELKNLINKAEE